MDGKEHFIPSNLSILPHGSHQLTRPRIIVLLRFGIQITILIIPIALVPPGQLIGIVIRVCIVTMIVFIRRGVVVGVGEGIVHGLLIRVAGSVVSFEGMGCHDF